MMGTSVLRNPAIDGELPPMAAPVRMSAAPMGNSVNKVDPHAAMTAPIGPTPDVMSLMAPTPQVTLDPDSMNQTKGNDQNRLMADERKDANPYGTPGNHPGFGGKLLHGLNVARNIAETAFAPGIAMADPSSTFHREVEEGGLKQGIADIEKQQSEQALQGAQTAQSQEVTKELPGKTQSEEALQGAQEQHELNPEATTPDMATYRALTSMGMSPKDALQEIEKDKALGLAPRPMEAKTLQLPNGQQVAGKTDSQGNLLLEDGTPAPKGSKLYQQPNYAMMLPQVLGSKTTEMLGPDNVQHRYQYDPESRAYDIDMGASPTGTAAHQIFQGAAIEQLAPQIIGDINANRAILGNLPSYYKQWLAGTPVSDPNAAQMMTELMSFAAMQPALHAFRSMNAMEAFEKMIGGLAKNPDSTIATINGLLKTPEAFTNLPNSNRKSTSGGNNAPQRPAGVPENAQYITDPKTGKKGWAW